MVATGRTTGVFRSLESVPVRVRRKMVATAARGNSATILIADRAGRRELARAAGGLPSAIRPRARATLRSRLAGWVAQRPVWFDIAVLGLGGALLWAAVFLK